MKYLSILLIAMVMLGCKTVQHVADADVSYYRVDEKMAQQDSAINAWLAPYQSELAAQMAEIIGTVEADLQKDKPNSDLGNWFADALLEEAEKITGRDIDFAVQNYGGLRLPSIPRGPLTTGKIYELMPFDNMLVILEARKGIVQKLLDHIADYGGWPVSSGLGFRIEEGKAVDVTINGQPLSDDKMYAFALPDYIANGGDGSHFLSEAKSTDTGVFIRDAIIENTRRKFETGAVIESNKDVRIQTR